MNHVTSSLISFIMRPLLPHDVLNCAFACFASSFSCALFSKKYSGCAPTMGNPIILEMSATSICMGLSVYRMTPWTRATSFLMQRPKFLPRPKCGRSNKFMMSELYSPIIQCALYNTSLPRGLTSPVLIK
jgi:hypothetical protein